MIRRFEDLPVQTKLALVVMVLCSTLVLLMAFLFAFDKYFSFRQSMVENHTMLAETIAKNSTAALAFDDIESALATLSALRVVKDVIEAAIFTNDGTNFAAYRKNDTLDEDTGVSPEVVEKVKNVSGEMTVYIFNRDYLDLAAPITLDGKRLGYLTIRADLKELHDRLQSSILVVITLIILLGVVAQIISVRLHRYIARPLLDLLDTTEAVKRDSDYSYRVIKHNNDEFGALSDGFNTMLAEIEKRDEELAKHRNHLEALVEQRTRELRLANEQLHKEIEERMLVQDRLARAQRMEAIGTLAAGVAHDLNNILSGVVSYPDLLLMRLPKDHEMRGALKTIRTSGNKAAAIVQDLMTLARRGAMTMEVVDLEKVIDEYLASPECAKMLEHHTEVRIARKTDRGLQRIKGSPVHLSKTVMNLVTNAAEAIAGAGVISIGLENAYLDRPLPGYDQVEEGCYVKMVVTDTGHGISAEDIRFIFEPFYTRKKMGLSGTGLGMAVVWGTVEDHKGYIVVSSAPGEGAVFSLYFPATMELNVVEQMEDLQQYRGRGESILVVDDIREQRIIATDILREFGYRVDAVAGGEEAVEYLRTAAVDLLLLDMIMDPGIDGIETFRRVVQNNPDQRALIASGYSDVNQIELARSLGVAGYLRKPYTIAGLAKSVRQELDRDRK